ncbi:MAG TPA: hypothetical protein D7I09_03450, partial [Candidatus Poseidoniales archaeon]
MATPISMPSLPPEGPWDAYVLVIIWLPLLFRLLLLVRPARQAVAKVAPHAGWALKQLRDLPVRGLRLLIFNETLALLAPPIIVLLYRQLADPIGWQTWEDVSLLGGTVLMFLTLVWLVLDLMRIGRTRRMLLAVIKQDVDRLRKVADVGLGARRLLRRFAREDEDPEGEEEQNTRGKVWSIAKKAGGIALLSRKFTPQGLAAAVAWSAAEEAARRGAAQLSV